MEEFANEFIFTAAADILLESVVDGKLRAVSRGYALSRNFSTDLYMKPSKVMIKFLMEFVTILGESENSRSPSIAEIVRDQTNKQYEFPMPDAIMEAKEYSKRKW